MPSQEKMTEVIQALKEAVRAAEWAQAATEMARRLPNVRLEKVREAIDRATRRAKEALRVVNTM